MRECVLQDDILKVERAEREDVLTDTLEMQRLDASALPEQVHHALTRIVGIALLDQVFVVPGSVADLMTRREEPESAGARPNDPDQGTAHHSNRSSAGNSGDGERPAANVATTACADAAAEADTNDADVGHSGSGNESMASVDKTAAIEEEAPRWEQRSRHRPRKSDPNSDIADYVPVEDRQAAQQAVDVGDTSIEELERGLGGREDSKDEGATQPTKDAADSDATDEEAVDHGLAVASAEQDRETPRDGVLTHRAARRKNMSVYGKSGRATRPRGHAHARRETTQSTELAADTPSEDGAQTDAEGAGPGHDDGAATSSAPAKRGRKRKSADSAQAQAPVTRMRLRSQHERRPTRPFSP